MTSPFYQSHLERVSRSFSFCIAQLEGDFREWVSLSYLLCRVLDTVEDASWPSQAEQASAYHQFQGFLDAPVADSKLAAWIQTFPTGISEGEKLLILDSGGCFSRFHALPENIRKIMRASILNMYRGMNYFSTERKQGARGIRLRSLADLNQYCFFVAGVVGDLLTNLLAGATGTLVDSSHLLDAHHFGLFLQKVNVLKDQREDEAQDRFLVVPTREAVLASAKANAEGAIRYILAVPVRERGYRTFCAWSLFMGLSTLRWMERTTFFGHVFMNKPPRITTKRLLGRVTDRIDDNEALLKFFSERLPVFPSAGENFASSGKNEASSLQAYEGPLNGTQLQALGIT
ncbi:MAG: squalene/phytoene synthase family protein [Bdellovibrionota bacterium]